jgi:hypothetical protein
MMLKIPHIYLDTSVIGGCFDEEFEVWSNALIDDIHKGLFNPAVSSIVQEEIDAAPPRVKSKYQELLTLGVQMLSVDEQALLLVEQYVKHEIIPPKFRNDLYHIALATIAEIDILVSWNFQHIVRYDKIQQFNAVNLENGFRTLAIYSPREVTYYGKEV